MKAKISIVILLFWVLIGCSHLNTNTSISTNKVCFKDNCFEVELAITAAQHTQGLMFRKKLGQNKGMLFVFEEEGRYNFWMKNTLIPLDIIWINKDKEVVFIKENAQPCKQDSCPALGPDLKPDQEAKYVLELNSGKVSRLKIKNKDKVVFIINTI